MILPPVRCRINKSERFHRFTLKKSRSIFFCPAPFGKEAQNLQPHLKKWWNWRFIFSNLDNKAYLMLHNDFSGFPAFPFLGMVIFSMCRSGFACEWPPIGFAE
jgi:hypothetical protein